METKPFKAKKYEIPTQKFDNFNPDIPLQQALGSKRGREIQEVSEIRSTNFKQVNGIIVSGWRLSRRGLEIALDSGTFPPGTIQFVDIQNINTARILGRISASTGVIQELSAANVKTILALVASDISDFNEAAQDAVGSILSAEFTYNDGAPSISINTIASSKITNFSESVEDVIGGILGDTNTIDFVYNDGSDSITANVRHQNSSSIDLTDDGSGLKAVTKGASGSFTTADLKTVTVVDGLITAIV